MSFSDPKENVAQMHLSQGAHVADLGAGSGAYAIAASETVGSEGRIFAIEVQKDLLAHIRTLAHKSDRYNIEVVWGDLERIGSTKLRDASIDAVIIANVLFQLEDRDTFLKEVLRIARPDGTVLVVDWTESFGNMGPAREHVFKEKDAKALFLRHNFRHERDISAGAHHYGFILRR